MFLIFIMPLVAVAQNEKGIQFQRGMSWAQVKSKAKEENKYIFLDCFATWCGPCKKMDKEVYISDTVGKYMNARFISVKVQIDTSGNDNDEIKKWYAAAREIKNEYWINSVPTYLFFSPEGIVVHKDIGSRGINGFISIASSALKSDMQYFTLLENYKKGERVYPVMPDLAKNTRRFGEKTLASQIAMDYIDNYLNKLSEGDFLKKDNVAFIWSFPETIKSNDRICNLCQYSPKRIDSVMGVGYSEKIIDYIISRDEVTLVVNVAKIQSKTPNWDRLFHQIKQKYGAENAERNILVAKTEFYRERKDWKSYTKYLVQEVERELSQDNVVGLKGSYYLNDMAWPVFQYSNDRNELSKALSWSNLSLKLDSTSLNAPNTMDTKANLLYKMGKKEDAIAVEEKAAIMSPQSKVIQNSLEKMKKSKPTW